MDVTRTFQAIHPSDLKELESKNDFTLVFKITAPGKLVSSNATRTDGNTAIWEVKPRDIFSENGKEFTARYNFATPWLTYLLIAMTVLAVAAFLHVLLKKRSAS